MSSPAKLVVFVCNWDGLSCIESAAQKRLTFPASVKIIRVSCLSRVHDGLILKAFELGADGVMLLGCDSRSCHFGITEDLINQNIEKVQAIRSLLGQDEHRLVLVRLPHGDGVGFIKRIKEFFSQFAQASPV
jgi:coenzyme F420-reducing hydrogenase delta subunit